MLYSPKVHVAFSHGACARARAIRTIPTPPRLMLTLHERSDSEHWSMRHVDSAYIQDPATSMPKRRRPRGRVKIVVSCVMTIVNPGIFVSSDCSC